MIVGVLGYFLSNKDSEVSLTKVFEVTFEDLVQLNSVPLNSFQYLALGPTLMSSVNISDMFMGTLIGPYGMLDIEDSNFWRLLNVCFGIHSIWLVAFILVVLRNAGFRKLSLLVALAVYLIPFMCAILFLPLLLYFLELFVCTEAHSPPGTSPSLDDSFMKRDCNQDCWTGNHLNYSIPTCIFCCIFVATRAYAIIMWQALTPDMNIKAKRSYLHLKTLFEVVLLLSSHIVRRVSETVHAIIFIVVLTLFLLETTLRSPFNYSRLNLGLGVCLGICLSLGWLGLVQLYVPSVTGVTGDFITLGVFVGVVGEGYLGIGLVVQARMLPNLVRPSKLPYEGELFKFAFDLSNVEPPPLVKTRGVVNTTSSQLPDMISQGVPTLTSIA